MKAVGLYRYLPIENPASLVDLELEQPTPGGRDLLVQVKAISVNPVDTKVRKPKAKEETEPRLLGWDVAGIVEKVGPECTLFKPGDEVYYAGSITRPGGNSEFHLVDERIVGRKPRALSWAQAAALPLTAITAWEALFDRLVIDPLRHAGAPILIVGAAGGVGSIAVQLARWAGLQVIATASRPESAEWVRSLGANAVIDHTRPFLPQLQELGLPAVPYILCLYATDQHWTNMEEAVAPQGKICSIVETDLPLDLSLLQHKSVTFTWEFMFTRSMYQTPDMIEQHRLLTRLAEMVDQGLIKSTLTEVISPINAANLRTVHARLETGRTIGKVVLEQW